MSEFAVIENEKLKKQSNDNIVNLTLQTIDFGKQVLIFNNSKRSSEASAEKVAYSVKNVENSEKLKSISKKILSTLSSPTKQCFRLAKCIEKGIAFHHSGLAGKQRTLIEEAFKEGIIKVISATPTLSAGMNLPAYKVIIKDYKRYSQRGFADIPVLEFHQMAGRAGRPGKELVGKSVLCVKTEDEMSKVIPKYIFGEPEEIISKLAVEPTLKMYILSLLSMDIINTKEEIIEFFSNSFYAHQYGDIESLKYNLFRIIRILKDYDFVEQEDDYYRATPMGKKISELYLNPDTANYFLENIEKFFKVFSKDNVSKYDIYSLIYFVVNTMEMRPTFSVSKTEGDFYAKRLEEVGDSLIIKFDPFEMDYSNFLSLLKTSDIFQDWISEAHEDFLSEKYRVTPGELNYKVEIMDWLLYCLEEISLLKKNFYFRNYLMKLRTRFNHGIKEELIPLINLKSVGRVRARKLFNGGFKKISDLKVGEFDKISALVGDSITIKIKKQVVENFDEVMVESLINKKPKQIKIKEMNNMVESSQGTKLDYSSEEKEKNFNENNNDNKDLEELNLNEKIEKNKRIKENKNQKKLNDFF